MTGLFRLDWRAFQAVRHDYRTPPGPDDDKTHAIFVEKRYDTRP
jgi:hypothetical protein